MAWEICNIGDVVEIIDYRGKTPDKADEGIKTLSAKSVKAGYIDYENTYCISQETYNKFMVRGIPHIGDILMTTEAPLGNVARLDRDDVAIAQRLLLLRGKKNILDNDFLMYYLRSNKGQTELYSRATGTTVLGIKQSKFKEIPITLPPLDIQKKISAVLNDYDQKMIANKNHISLLENLTIEIYREMFINKQRNMGWEVIKFNDFLTPSVEKIGNQQVPVYSATNKGIVLREQKFNKNLSKSLKNNKKVVRDDLIFGLSREILNFGVFKDEIGSVSPIYQIFKVDKAVILPFILELEIRINMHKYMDILQLGAREGQGIRRDYLLQKEFIVPPMELQLKFEEIAKPIEQKIVKLKEENEVLAEIRDTLLSKLMSGELPVEVGEN